MFHHIKLRIYHRLFILHALCPLFEPTFYLQKYCDYLQLRTTYLYVRINVIKFIIIGVNLLKFLAIEVIHYIEIKIIINIKLDLLNYLIIILKNRLRAHFIITVILKVFNLFQNG